MHQKQVTDPFLIMVNNPKQLLHARTSFENILKEDYQKAFKKLTLLFLSNLHFKWTKLSKTGPGTSDWSLFRL